MDVKNMQKEKKKWKSDGAISWKRGFWGRCLVDDVGIGFEKKKKKRDCGSWVSRIEGRNADDDLEGQIKECELHWLEEVGLAMEVKDE